MSSSIYRPLYMTDNSIQCFFTEDKVRLFFPSGKSYDGETCKTIYQMDIDFMEFAKKSMKDEMDIKGMWLDDNPKYKVYRLDRETTYAGGFFTVDPHDKKFELVIFGSDVPVNYYKVGTLCTV